VVGQIEKGEERSLVVLRDLKRDSVPLRRFIVPLEGENRGKEKTRGIPVGMIRLER